MSTSVETTDGTPAPTEPTTMLPAARVDGGLDRRTLLRGLGIAVVALIVGLFVPEVITSQSNMEIVTDGVVLGMLALSIGFLAHRSGLISLGHTAFYGGAAYALAIATSEWGWSPAQAVVFAVVGGTLLGLVIGAFVVRTPGVSFLVLTLAIGQALHELVVQDSVREVTGAHDGLAVSWGSGDTVAGLTQAQVGNAADFWPLAWVSLVVVLVALWLVGRSRFGRVLEGIRENEERARFSGFNTYAPRLVAFTLSAAIASLAGTLFALKASFVAPDALSFVTAGDSLIAALVGGIATLIGPLVGGVLYIWARGEFSEGGNLQLFTGAALIIAIVFLRGGVVGAATDAGRKVVGRVTTRQKESGR